MFPAKTHYKKQLKGLFINPCKLYRMNFVRMFIRYNLFLSSFVLKISELVVSYQRCILLYKLVAEKDILPDP